MNHAKFLLSGVFLCALCWAQANPPFHGTIFMDTAIVLPSDPTSFEGIAYTGQGQRTMYDRRPANWISVNAWLFEARFAGGTTCEIQVNPEFSTQQEASEPALQFARVIGQLPAALRKDVETVWIHRGVHPFGGGNRNLLIHVGQADAYIAQGILEEVLFHEASHTSLDSYHASAPGWLAAQSTDGGFISTYARDEPVREDIAESFLPWFAVRYRGDRISRTLKQTIETTIPARLAYFDALALDLSPAVSETTAQNPVVFRMAPYLQWRAQYDLKGRALFLANRRGQ